MSWGERRTALDVSSVRSDFPGKYSRKNPSSRHGSKLLKTFRSNNQDYSFHPTCEEPSQGRRRNSFEWKTLSEGISNPSNFRSQTVDTSGDRETVDIPKQVDDLCDTMMPVMSISLCNHREKNNSLIDFDEPFSPAGLVGVKYQRGSKKGVCDFTRLPSVMNGGMGSELPEWSSISPAPKFESSSDPEHLARSATAVICPRSTTTSNDFTHGFPLSSLSPRENGTTVLPNDLQVFETVFSSPFIEIPKMKGLVEASVGRGRGRDRGNILQLLGDKTSFGHDVEHSREPGKKKHDAAIGMHALAHVPQQQRSSGAEGCDAAIESQFQDSPSTSSNSSPLQPQLLKIGRRQILHQSMSEGASRAGTNGACARPMNGVGRGLLSLRGTYEPTPHLSPSIGRGHRLLHKTMHVTSVHASTMPALTTNTEQLMQATTSQPTKARSSFHAATVSSTWHEACNINQPTGMSSAQSSSHIPSFSKEITSQKQTVNPISQPTPISPRFLPVTTLQSTSSSSKPAVALTSNCSPEPPAPVVVAGAPQASVTSNCSPEAPVPVVVAGAPQASVTSNCSPEPPAPVVVAGAPQASVTSNCSPEAPAPVVVAGASQASISSPSPQHEVGHFPLPQPTTPRSCSMPALEMDDDSSSPLVSSQLPSTALPSAREAEQVFGAALSSGDEKDMCIGRRSTDEVEKRIATLQRSIHCREVELKKILSKNEAMAREFESEMQDVVKEARGFGSYISTQRVKEFDNLLHLNARAVVATNSIKRGEATRKQFKTKAHAKLAKLGTNKLAKIELDLVLEEDALKEQIQAAKMQGSVLEHKLDFYINDNYM